MATDNRTRPEQNLAHVPVIDGYGTPIDTHPGTTPRESVAPREIDVGAAPFDANPPPRFTPVNNDFGETERLAAESSPAPIVITQRSQADASRVLPSPSSSHGAAIKPVGFGVGMTDTTER